MRIAIAGGGPGGLYLACLVKGLDSHDEVTVFERKSPADTFGFGVVFSDETLGGIEHADRVIFERMSERFASWDDVDIHLHGRTRTVGGQAFAAMDRRQLLAILQQRCTELGVTVRYRTAAPDVDLLSADYDLVVAADGVNSVIRSRYADVFAPSIETRPSQFMWLGTDKVFDAFKFYIAETPAGVMQVHGYPYSESRSTFIAEMRDDVWEKAGFSDIAQTNLAPGENDQASVERLRGLFADVLDGHDLIANNSQWISFSTVANAHWHVGNVVLLGDAAHTAHFSIGSGTKLAMEDALSLAACLHEHASVGDALASYEGERRPVVESTQRAAQASLEWFESLRHYTGQDIDQFAFNLMTRSRRITYDNLKMRDPDFVADADRWFARDTACRIGASVGDASGVAGSQDAVPPMFRPFRLGDLELKNRVIVSPMDMYSSTDGVPGDFHLVHLGSKALGGAALVMTEMVCVSERGRITPGCAGLYTDEQEAAWLRVTDFVHAASSAKIGLQIGHSGRKGSTKLMWEGIDDPLADGNWPVIGPSALPYSSRNQTPRETTPEEMDRIKNEFVQSAESGARAGFDLLELHCGHGYLLSSFLSPLSNMRSDEYGGSLENRLKFPLEVFDAVRAVWPDERPMSVRISATDWAAGGNGVDEAVQISRAFALRGVDAIDVSTGQVIDDEKPAFGRSYQTPFADRIRNEIGRDTGVAVIAVGAISSYDDVNSVLLAGRADLVALGRTHLYDPQWTLHAAAEQEYAGPAAAWPNPYAAGSRKPPAGRNEAARPRLELVRTGSPRIGHARWRPASAPV